MQLKLDLFDPAKKNKYIHRSALLAWKFFSLYLFLKNKTKQKTKSDANCVML